MKPEDYRRDFDRIHDQLDKIDAKLDDHVTRITKVETTQKGIAATLALMITSGVTATMKYFNLG